MDVILIPLYNLISTVFSIYFWILIASVVMSWLQVFGVGAGNPLMGTIGEFLFRVTEPVLGPIRRILPDLGGLDISPLVALLGLHFIQQFLFLLFTKLMGAS